MILDDLVALLPLMVVAGFALLTMLVIAFNRNHLLVALLSLIGLGAAFATIWVAVPTTPRRVTALFVLDSFSLFYIGLLLLATIAVVVLAYGYFERRRLQREEFYLLLLLATLGSAALAASNHFASFFLGLEILSVSLFALLAYPRTVRNSIEAGIKYLILASASSAFLLFGMALIYAELGTMQFDRIAQLQRTSPTASSLLMLGGLSALIVGIGFKLAVVPFHMWAPDVYQGAPAPATAFLATVSKGGIFALLLRFFTQLDVRSYDSLVVAFSLIAIASMLGGNLLALLQDNVKRILAYSSIAHMGYMLVAFLAGGTLGISAATFYLVAYFVTILAAFGVVTVLSTSDEDAESMDHYRGLFYRRPLPAAILTAALLSLAGMPLTAGFIGKFYLITAGVSVFWWLLVVVLVLSSAIGLFFYLRVVSAMYQRPTAEGQARAVATSTPPAGGLVLAILVLLLLWLGVYPGPLIELIQATVGALL
ncbi:MAG: NADH-quinone oxidoreductase subunit N [Chloroflexota bacterium]